MAGQVGESGSSAEATRKLMYASCVPCEWPASSTYSIMRGLSSVIVISSGRRPTTRLRPHIREPPGYHAADRWDAHDPDARPHHPRSRSAPRPCGRAASLCAKHVRQLGGESPPHNRMEVKC